MIDRISSAGSSADGRWLRKLPVTHAVITGDTGECGSGTHGEMACQATTLVRRLAAGATVYAVDRSGQRQLRQTAETRQLRFECVDSDDLARITWDDLQRFPCVEAPDQVALALRVCTDLGVPRAAALAGMWQAAPDPGRMTLYHVRDAGQSLLFVNGFAAIDQELGNLRRFVTGDRVSRTRPIAVVNCRADRPDRSRRLAEVCVQELRADRYLLIGSATEPFVHRAMEMGVLPTQIVDAQHLTLARVLRILRRTAGAAATILGIGHISGLGQELVEYYRQLAVSPTFARTENVLAA